VIEVTSWIDLDILDYLCGKKAARLRSMT